MPIDIKQALEGIAKLERLQAQIEMRSAQIKEEENQLLAKLKLQGIKPEELDQKIKELEALIDSKLTMIHDLDKPLVGAPNGQEAT